jgi:hypothetical protein
MGTACATSSVALADYKGWSLCGAPWLQLVATGSKRDGAENGSQAKMVRRGRRFESVRGLCQSPAHKALPFGSICTSSNVRQVWSPLWSLRVENAVRDRTLGLRYEPGAGTSSSGGALAKPRTRLTSDPPALRTPRVPVADHAVAGRLCLKVRMRGLVSSTRG